MQDKVCHPCDTQGTLFSWLYSEANRKVIPNVQLLLKVVKFLFFGN